MTNIEELTTTDLEEIVRYHGAGEVIDALIVVAVEVYGADQAVDKLDALVLSRWAGRVFGAAQ